MVTLLFRYSLSFGKNKKYYFWILALLCTEYPCLAIDGSGSLVSEGFTRTFTYHAPGTAIAANLPVVIVMHGDGGTGSGIKSYAGFDAVANANNFIAIYPDALNGAWNRYVDNQPGDAGLSNPSAPDDVLFISNLIDYFCTTYHINPARIYATGHSAGGFMAYNLAIRLPNRVAAFAPVAASLWGDGPFITNYFNNSFTKVPLMHIHGDADNTVNYPDPNHTPNNWNEWPLNNFGYFNCGTMTYSSTTDVITGVKKITFCPGGGTNKEVVLFRIVGGGHGWPNVSGWNAAEQIWNFFKDYSITTTTTCAPVASSVAIQINTTTGRKAISPLIYGLNPYHYHASLTGMSVNEANTGVTSLRFGGDAVSTYNWEKNTNTSWNSSCCATYSSNDNNRFLAYASGQLSAQFGSKAGAPLKLISDANSLSAYSLIQISAAQYVAKDDLGCIRGINCGAPATTGRLDEVSIQSPSALTTTPDLTDNFVYADEEVNYLISQAGLSTAGGVKGYCLENEPGIWHATHPLNHPVKASCLEVITKNSTLAKRIKDLDPNAETFGPGMFGFSEYVHLNNEGSWGNPNYYPTDWATYNMSNVSGFNAANYQYMTWLCSYLRQMKLASDTAGKRLLDGLDIHFYNQGNNPLQDSRSFWDPTYIENSWITNDVIGGQPLFLANYLNKAINDFYPGTKLAITEWGNFTDYNQVTSGIYTADLLGAFGKNNVYLSTYFGRLMGYPAGAFKLFRNYDGNNARYGNTSVTSQSVDNSKITAYASIKDTDEEKLHIILINRSSTSETASLSMTNGTGINYSTAEVYAMESTGNGTITQKQTINNITDNQLSYSLSPYTVYHFVVNGISAPLPVTLLEFKAEKENENLVLLKWKTASEINSDRYVLEKSRNNLTSFSPLAEESAKGSPTEGYSYQFVDNNPSGGTYYYRLKTFDKDGKFQLSPVVSVSLKEPVEFTLAPSPAQTSFTIQNYKGKFPAELELYDTNGKQVMQLQLQKKEQKINVSSFASGVYFVKINGSSGKRLVIFR